jgi:anaerobic magnesium-protoporphyrin IX monomethyl ester cyclase
LARARGIQSGMFLMWGYEDEQMPDIEATIEHVKRSRPDIFFTTVAYPIKGTPYYEQTKDRLVQLEAWSKSSDREIKIRGRHSRRFYDYADRVLRDEVKRSLLASQSATDPALVADLENRIRAGRQGMVDSYAEVEA